MAELQQPVLTDPCIHRWRVGTPVGDACQGSCAICGAVRLFTNERRPFGQPGRPRRALAAAPPALVRPSMDAAVAAPFLAAVDPLRRDGVLPD